MILIDHRGDTSHDGLQIDSLSDLATLRDRDDLRVSRDTLEHESTDHDWTDIAGQVAVGVTDDDGRTLLMANEDLGIVALPHGDVQPDEDWLAATRREIEALTGVAIALEEVVLLREIDHAVAGESVPHASTYGLLFRGSPNGGEIQGCKASAAAGSDGWYADWFDGIPAGLAIPEGGPGEDLELILG